MTFIEANLDAQSVPLAEEVDVFVSDPEQDFHKGALGRLTDTGKFVEATSPAAGGDVSHVAQGEYGAGATSGPFAGFGTIGGRRDFPTGRVVTTRADACRFRAGFNSTLPATVGGTYDAVIDANGRWIVDFAGGAGDLLRYLGPIPDLGLTTATSPAINSGQPKEVLVEFVAAGVATALTPLDEDSL